MTRMNQTLYERRLDSLRFHSRGIPPSVWTKELAQKYKVFADTIWRDWNQRHTWLPVVANMKNPETVMAGCVQENIQVKQAAWKLYHSAQNDTAKAAALKVILEVNDRLFSLTSPSLEFSPREIKLRWIGDSEDQSVELDVTDEEDVILTKAAGIIDRKRRKKRSIH